MAAEPHPLAPSPIGEGEQGAGGKGSEAETINH